MRNCSVIQYFIIIMIIMKHVTYYCPPCLHNADTSM